MAKLKTGRHTSALKEARKNEGNRLKNRSTLGSIRALTRKLDQAIIDGDVQTARSLINDTFSTWDKAAKKKIIHWKSAARTKSRFARKFHHLLSSRQQ
ncbi:MAG: 30S ribosomal protein S20 [Elusimicrobia bacterium]|nr:30S ribosomal protein S20 [Elusimicrobiota bacterium]MBD3412582.1 30S ribosomal protein S20 [Elusimicrobiota bacterium]